MPCKLILPLYKKVGCKLMCTSGMWISIVARGWRFVRSKCDKLESSKKPSKLDARMRIWSNMDFGLSLIIP